jgi:hypothetical protein
VCSSSKHGKVSWKSSNPKVLVFVAEAGEDGKPLYFYNTATGQSNAPMVFMNASFTYADLKSMGSMAPGFLYKVDGGYLGTFAFMTPRKFCPPTESNVIDTSKVVQIDLSKWNFYKCYK